MNKEEKLVWDRLKNGVPRQPMVDPEEIRAAFMRGARSMGETTLAMQALGRALRKNKDALAKSTERST